MQRVGLGNRFHPVAHGQLAIDILDVRAYGADRHDEFFGNFGSG